MTRQILVLAILSIFSAGAFPARSQEEGTPEPPAGLWTKSLALSGLVTSGNSETTSVGVNVQAKRKATPWGFAIRANALRTENDDIVSAERYLGSLRVERALSERWSMFGSGRAEQDELAGYELRTVTEFGTLYNLLTGPVHELSTRVGLTYTTEDAVVSQDGGSSDEFLGAVLGSDWTWQIRDGSRLTETLELFPNFDASDDWRLAANLAYQSDLARFLALQVGFELRYDNRPLVDADGRKLDSTDTALTLSFVLGDRE